MEDIFTNAVEETAKPKTNKATELQKQLKEKEAEIKARDEKILNFETQLKALQEQMNFFTQGGVAQRSVSTEQFVTIGCNMLTGATICTKDESLLYNFEYNQVMDIELSELNDCFKNTVNNYRNLFRDGVFYFEDKAMYSKFRINEVLDMSDEFLIKELEAGKIPHIQKIGTDPIHRNDRIFYVVMYKTADLLARNKLNKWNFDGLDKFQKFFKVDVRKLASEINTYKQ